MRTLQTALLSAMLVSGAVAFDISGVGIDLNYCAQSTIGGGVKYVATTGNDTTADGSIAKPYATIARAVEQAQSGETILIRGGTYYETQEIRVRVPHLIIRSYPAEWAVIDISAHTGPTFETSGIYLYVDADNAKVSCLEIVGGYYGVSTETRWDWGDPQDRGGPENITLEHLKIHGSYADGIKIKPKSNGMTITHCEIYNTGVGQNPEECNAEGIDNVNADGAHVSYTHIHDACSNGLYFKGGARDCVVEHSLIERSGAGGVMLGFDTSPEYFDLVANPDYYEAIRPVAHHNLLRHNKGSGIGLYASKDARIYNNTVIESGERFHAPLYLGITYQDWDESALRPANINPSIHHNIFAQTTTQNVALVSIRHSDDLGGLDGLEGSMALDNNCYFQAAAAAQFADGRASEWEGDFAGWQTHIGADARSLEIDPQLDTEDRPTAKLCRDKGYQANGFNPVPTLYLLLQ